MSKSKKRKKNEKSCKMALVKELLLPIDAIVPMSDALSKEGTTIDENHKENKKGKMIGYALFYALVDKKER